MAKSFTRNNDRDTEEQTKIYYGAGKPTDVSMVIPDTVGYDISVFKCFIIELKNTEV